MLGSWREEFKSDPAMASIAALYKQCRVDPNPTGHQDLTLLMNLQAKDNEKKKQRQEREEAKERQRMEEEARRNNPQRKKRAPFDFEKVLPSLLMQPL